MTKLEQLRKKIEENARKEAQQLAEIQSIEAQIRSYELAKEEASTYEEFAENERKKSDAKIKLEWLRKHSKTAPIEEQEIEATWNEERATFEKGLAKDLKAIATLKEQFCKAYKAALDRQRELLKIRNELLNIPGESLTLDLGETLPNKNGNMLLDFPGTSFKPNRSYPNPEALAYGLWSDPERNGQLYDEALSILACKIE